MPDQPEVALPAGAAVPKPAVGNLEVKLLTSFKESAELRDRWDRASVDLQGSIYFSFDWARTWWDFYGAGKQLRIFVFSNQEQIVGILPLYIDRIGLKPLQFSVARLVCSNIPPKAFSPAIDPAWAEAIFESALARLIQDYHCDLISLGPVSDNCRFLEAFESAARKRDSLCGAISKTRAGVHTLFELPGSLEEFFEGMEKDERKKRKYEMRLLAKEPAIKRDVLSAPADLEPEFERFATLHASQWIGKGKLGHFGSWPNGKQYNLALVRSLASLGRVRFVRILSGEEVISSQFAFVFGDTWYWELPARLMDRKWSRFSLGTTGFFCLVEEAIKEGKSRIEGGIAHYDYKQKLGGKELGLDILRVVAKRSGSKLRNRLFSWLRSFLLVVYYKIWYARVSPRLPAPLRKPIWSFWLRLDF